MKVLPPEGSDIIKKPAFPGNLASDKHFTPQEINKLHFKRPDSKKSIVKEELKKTNGPIRAYNGTAMGITEESNEISQ